jgi:HD-GYP domain-containing protein (c-di-GMP phosphodiesterase class II)
MTVLRRHRLPPSPDEGNRWRSRPVSAAAVRAAVVLIPAVCAIVAVTLVDRLVDPPTTWPLRIGWWLLLLALSTVVALAVERQSRRLLPMAVLLKLTLLFPDDAPSRYKVARGAGNPERLRQLAADERNPLSTAAMQVLGWVANLSGHDRHTRGHSERVRIFGDLIAEELHVTGLDRDKLRWAALLHDIGKLRVPTTVLNKPGRPTSSEWELLRAHPEVGLGLVGPLADWLGPWAGGIADHHERFDGTGYPRGASGEEISLAGRIVSVADAFETMTASRSYKLPMAAAAARVELARCAGTHFDPEVVRAFLSVGLPRTLYSIGPISFLLHMPFLSRFPEVGLSVVSAAGQAAAPLAAGLTAASVMTATVVAPVAFVRSGHSEVRLRAASANAAQTVDDAPAGSQRLGVQENAGEPSPGGPAAASGRSNPGPASTTVAPPTVIPPTVTPPTVTPPTTVPAPAAASSPSRPGSGSPADPKPPSSGTTEPSTGAVEAPAAAATGGTPTGGKPGKTPKPKPAKPAKAPKSSSPAPAKRPAAAGGGKGSTSVPKPPKPAKATPTPTPTPTSPPASPKKGKSPKH